MLLPYLGMHAVSSVLVDCAYGSLCFFESKNYLYD